VSLLLVGGGLADYRPALVIDCSEIGKAKNDAGLVSALAEETGKLATHRRGLAEYQATTPSSHSYLLSMV
jgi:hypothetical protein